MKTTVKRAEALRALVVERHPSDLPVIVSHAATTDRSAADWIAAETEAAAVKR